MGQWNRSSMTPRKPHTLHVVNDALHEYGISEFGNKYSCGVPRLRGTRPVLVIPPYGWQSNPSSYEGASGSSLSSANSTSLSEVRVSVMC